MRSRVPRWRWEQLYERGQAERVQAAAKRGDDFINGCASKKRYSEEKLARRVAEACKKDRGVRLRVYWCAHCGGYHLTKQAG